MVRTSFLLSLLSGWVPIPGPGTKIPEAGPGTKIPEAMLCDQKKKYQIFTVQGTLCTTQSTDSRATCTSACFQKLFWSFCL